MSNSTITVNQVLKMLHSTCPPIEVWINGKCVWADDLDITNMTNEESNIAFLKLKHQYEKLFEIQDTVIAFKVKIKEIHHCIVYFILEGDNEK